MLGVTQSQNLFFLFYKNFTMSRNRYDLGLKPTRPILFSP